MREILLKIGFPQGWKRFLLLFVDASLTIVSYFLSYLLRFNFSIPEANFPLIYKSLPLLIFFRVISFLLFRLYSGMWRYASVDELIRIIKAVTLGTLLFVSSIGFIFHLMGFPRSVFLIDWFIILVFLGGVRFIYRIWRESQAIPQRKARRRVLIVGAGDLGEMVLRSIRREGVPYEVVGLLDDDPAKIGRRIHGVRVLGEVSRLREVAQKKGVKEVILAIKNISGDKIREITRQCQPLGIPCKVVPAMGEILKGRISMSQLRPVRVEDLLRREPVALDVALIKEFISGKVIMVTGAGGSIGSELCRQILGFSPAKLLLFERAENSLFEINVDLREEFPDTDIIIPIVGDVLDVHSLRQVMREYRPQVVFHAAAYKHVPIMELHPFEAIKNNIEGTYRLAFACCDAEVEKFVLISTDKAVNPVSVMGATKRAAEMICQGLDGEGPTRFVAVRFGNVLESNGSVIPYFKRQIARGGPVTVTHPEATRYFMTIPEAAQLVLQAAAMGRGGEIYLLDMGEPVRILDLARDLIALSGLVEGEDIEIKFVGLRPGEKLHEELVAEKEELMETSHPKIFKIRPVEIDWEGFKEDMEALFGNLTRMNREELFLALQRLVPEYRPQRD